MSKTVRVPIGSVNLPTVIDQHTVEQHKFKLLTAATNENDTVACIESDTGLYNCSYNLKYFLKDSPNLIIPKVIEESDTTPYQISVDKKEDMQYNCPTHDSIAVRLYDVGELNIDDFMSYDIEEKVSELGHMVNGDIVNEEVEVCPIQIGNECTQNFSTIPECMILRAVEDEIDPDESKILQETEENEPSQPLLNKSRNETKNDIILHDNDTLNLSGKADEIPVIESGDIMEDVLTQKQIHMDGSSDRTVSQENEVIDAYIKTERNVENQFNLVQQRGETDSVKSFPSLDLQTPTGSEESSHHDEIDSHTTRFNDVSSIQHVANIHSFESVSRSVTAILQKSTDAIDSLLDKEVIGVEINERSNSKPDFDCADDHQDFASIIDDNPLLPATDTKMEEADTAEA